MYSFVDQNNCTFLVHVVDFEFPSFGFDRRFQGNHYKAISFSTVPVLTEVAMVKCCKDAARL